MRKLGIAAVALLLVWVAALVFAKASFKSECDRGWIIPEGSLLKLRENYPPQETNESATRLEELAARLQIDLVPRIEAPKRERGQFDSKEIDTLLRDYTKTCAEKQQLSPAPGHLAAFLTRSKADIQLVSDHLRHQPAPKWVMNLREGFDAPLPNLLGHMKLHRVLTGAALHDAASGNTMHAWELLEAAVKLEHSLIPRPELISQLIAIAEGKLVSGAMRIIPGSAPPWALQPPGYDAKERMLVSFAGEANGLAVFIENAGLGGIFTTIVDQEPNLFQKLASVAISPYVVFSAAHTLRAYKETINTLAKSDACASEPPPEHQFPRWNIFGRIQFPDFKGPWTRLHIRLVDDAGTRLILRLAGAAPVELPPNPCSVGWIHATNPDGTIQVRYTKPIEYPNPPTTLRLPTEAVIQRGR